MPSMLVHDDRQQRWYVTEDDPAWKLVNTLVRLGYRKIVLPNESIKIGSVPHTDNEAVASLADTYNQLEAVRSDPDLLTSVGAAFLHTSVLYDCCLALQNEVY